MAELLELIAAREPAPGGGSAAAIAGAVAAALVQMAAAFAGAGAAARGGAGEREAGDSGMGEWAAGDRGAWARAGALRARLTALAEEDLESYRPVLTALALPPGSPERALALARALSGAAEVPLAIALAAAEVAALGEAALRSGSRHLEGDATTAVLLAQAATRAAARLVELNLVQVPDDPRLAQVRAAVDRAEAASAM